MIDFHAHLDLYPNVVHVIQNIVNMNMYVLSVTTTPSAWEGTNALSINFPRIKTALGLHPQIAHERYSELPLFDRLISKTRYIGEIGLDGGKEFKDHWNIQTMVFEHILRACTNAGGKILSIHSRHATSEVLNFIEKYPKAGVPILHWFTGNKTELRRAISLGCWFSVGPAMLKSKRAIELVKEIPIDRLITETDGPFAQVNKVSAMPWDVAIALKQLSDILKMPYSEIERLIHNNFSNVSLR